MAILLFKLRGVPEDEAADIRALLIEHRIAFYETSAGNWGISLPAIWLRDDRQLAEARELIDDYQRRRQHAARQDYARAKQEDRQRTLLRVLQEEPLRAVIYLIIIAIIIYLSTVPFINFGD